MIVMWVELKEWMKFAIFQIMLWLQVDKNCAINSCTKKSFTIIAAVYV